MNHLLYKTISPPLGTKTAFPKEIDERGNVEYKLQLINLSEDRLVHLRTQMKWRVEEGQGEAIYRIGVKDNGDAVGLPLCELDESLTILRDKIAMPLGYSVHIETTMQCAACSENYFASARILPTAIATGNPGEVRVCLVGDAGCGKSTLIAVLANAQLRDDGKGKARRFVAQHKHEIAQGTTSSVSLHTLCSSNNNACKVENVFSAMQLNTVDTRFQCQQPPVVLMDTPGDKRFASTTFRAIASLNPDYLLICGNGEDYQYIACAMDIPCIHVAVKADLSPPSLMVDTRMQVSAVTGVGLDQLTSLLLTLPKLRTSVASSADNNILSVFKRFDMLDDNDDEEVAMTVFIGLVQSGSFQVRQEVWVGPTKQAQFARARIVSLRNANNLAVDRVQQDSVVGMRLDFMDQQQCEFISGAALIVTTNCIDPLWEFTIQCEEEEAALQMNQDIVIFVGAVCQPARIVQAHSTNCFTVRFSSRAECLTTTDVLLVRTAQGRMLVAKRVFK